MIAAPKDRRFRRLGLPDGDPYFIFRNEFHAFEVTAIAGLCMPVYLQMLSGGLPSIEWSFLPAPNTWIETAVPYLGRRQGAMLTADKNGDWCLLSAVAEESNGDIVQFPAGMMALAPQLERCALCEDGSEPIARRPPDMFAAEFDGILRAKFIEYYTYLLMINTPKLINRKTHVAHRGLQRDLRRLGGLTFPLQAWTEILLPITTIDGAGMRVDASGLAGRVCLHWTRSHKRRIAGVWTLIKDYWSGDASLGIKQSRYSLIP